MMPLSAIFIGLQLVAATPITMPHPRQNPDHDGSKINVLHPLCLEPDPKRSVDCQKSIAATAPAVDACISDHELTRYSVAYADLNGDDRPEALVYAVSTREDGNPDLCGSGGCTLYILSLPSARYREAGRISIGRPPIRILPRTTNGWRDISVHVVGGGINPGYDARLQYDGVAYPSNPSVPPATRLAHDIGVVAIATTPPLP